MKSLRKKTIRTPENVAAVRAALINSHKRSARKHALSLNLSSKSLRRILHSDINYHPYKVQVIQELKPADLYSRTTFRRETLTRMDENENSIQNVSKNGDIHWPPRSRGLSKPRNIDELKTKIKEELASTPLEVIRRVVKNIRSRAEECLRIDGHHLENIIFRK
ncbi:Hypothetical protein CINCED_3A012152 [Cinara cedri]|uniref:Uncharacterized protein n=1 Tax=Cinara cedri TaxID=506608 RepID=A0A5E4N0Y6_9HEMI|nr:Hypothetical protein CINCED_3A012152 [Cinara cedri]